MSRGTFIAIGCAGGGARYADDGNFHVSFVLNPNDPKEMTEAERLNERLVHRPLSLDDTRTGEHGMGCSKIDFLDRRARRGGERNARDQEGDRP
jgi:FAD/FMN-containing dehydrogenase